MKLFKRLFIPDTHAPFHDDKCFNLMLDVARDFRPDEVVFLGDFFDCYAVSQYTKDPLKYKVLEEELGEGRDLIRRVQNATKGASYAFLEGNHEWRIDRYVAANAAALGGSISTRDVLKLPPEFKWYPYGSRNRHQCGPKLIATHGSLCSKHSAASMVSKYGCSVIFGHTHRMQEFNVRTASGERLKGVTIGWLGDNERAAEYILNVHDSSHGFAVGWFKPSGDFWLQPIEIERHQLVWDGKLRG